MMKKNKKFYNKKPIQDTFFAPNMVLMERGKGLDGILRWLVGDLTSRNDR